MLTLNKFAAVAILVLLTACAAWQPAKNFDQQLAYSYSVHTAVLNTAAAGVETGTLTAADGSQVLRLADESRLLLDAARVASGVGDVTTAQGQLALATRILTELQQYLNARGAKS